jgi:predicted nuclease of predicted toxin-antitoxin system
VILDYAFDDNRVLVTLDHDFGELAARIGVPHHGIIRLTATPVAREAEICIRALEAYAQELPSGAIVTASPRRMRIRLARGNESS